MGKYNRLLSVVIYKMRVCLASKILGEPIFTDYQEVRHRIINSAVAIKGMACEYKERDKEKYLSICGECKIISEEAAKIQ